jgi:signal transduction histidine kinase
VLLITVVGTIALVGIWLLPETVILIRRIAGAKRRMVASWTSHDIPEAYQPITGTLRERLRTAVHDPGTLADLRWLACYYLYGALFFLTLPLWPLGLAIDGFWSGLLHRNPVILPLIIKLADLDARWSTNLLKPTPQAQLAARIRQLTATRADAITAHGAELRRIERDLHDGVQARLVSLSMRIGLAQRAYANDPDTARKLLTDAQDQAQEALTELRHVVRAIHPPILTDRGLLGAVRALAAASPLDVTVRVAGGLEDPTMRAPAAVEAAAYFAVAEALTNATKYSSGQHVLVRLERLRKGLRAVVEDDGRGGADETGGTGLLGIRRRVAALDGTIEVSSPVGGPTVIAVELPCVW